MASPIFYVDTSEIREGRLEELGAAMEGLVEFVENNEPRLLGYYVYFNGDGTRMTVIHVHPDSASLEYHMKVAGRLFPRFAHLVRLLTIDVYGEPTDAVLEQLRNKAQTLGSGSVTVHELHTGVDRIPSLLSGEV
jgi:quinol monooxygenase YgiN